MANLRYSGRSRDDLAAIWDYIGAESPPNADRVLDRICAKAEHLRSHPLIGHRRNDIRKGLRCLNCDGYLILYRYSAGIVRIDRVVHHSRDLPSLAYDPLS